MLKEGVDYMTMIPNVRKAPTSVEQSHATPKLNFVRYSKGANITYCEHQLIQGLRHVFVPLAGLLKAPVPDFPSPLGQAEHTPLRLRLLKAYFDDSLEL